MFIKHKPIITAGTVHGVDSTGAKSSLVRLSQQPAYAPLQENTLVANTAMGAVPTGVNMDTLLYDVAPEEREYDRYPLEIQKIYRDMYYYDSVAGATVDLYSSLPYGTWTLSGMDEKKLAKFQETLERLNIENLLPAATTDFMVSGAFLGNLLVSKERKLFTDIMMMQVQDITLVGAPLFGQQPIIQYTVPQHIRKYLSLGGSRVDSTMRRLGSLATKLRKGKFELHPLTALYIPRRSVSASVIGTSFLKRILPIYLIEKSLWKGTLIESSRRIRSILHIAAGDDNWDPSLEQIQSFGQMFADADADPIGAIVSTRNGVQVQEVRQGGEFWNIFNVWNETTPVKLRALGISEAFLSGDATLNNLESSISAFVDNLRASRRSMDNEFFYSRIFPLISLMNGYVKKGSKLPAEISNPKDGKLSVEDILRAAQDSASLEMPTLNWTKTLEPKGDAQFMEIMNSLQEKGVPLPIRTLAAAAGFNFEDLSKAYDQDVDDRRIISDYQKKLKKEAPNAGADEENVGEFSSGGRTYSRPRQKDPMFKSTARSFVDRDYGELFELRTPTKSGNGWKPIANQRVAQEKANKLALAATKNAWRKR